MPGTFRKALGELLDWMEGAVRPQKTQQNLVDLLSRPFALIFLWLSKILSAFEKEDAVGEQRIEKHVKHREVSVLWP